MKSLGKGVENIRICVSQPGIYSFLIILFLGTAIRFIGFQSFSLSNDELSAVTRLNFPDFFTMIKQGVEPDGHPAGVQSLLYFMVNIFGKNPFFIRLPFVLMGSAAILFFFLSAKKILGILPALFIASSIAFLEFPILYSQIARPYGSGLFLASLLFYSWIVFVFDFENKKSKLLITLFLAFSFALNLYNHYFSAQLAFFIGIAGLFFLRGKKLVYYLLAGILAIILFAPHIPISIKQIGYGGVGNWLGAPDNQWLITHLRYVFNDSYLVIIALLSVIALLKSRFFVNDIHIAPKIKVLSIILFIAPFLTGFFYSRLVNPVLQNSVLIFSFPYLLFFIFSFANKMLNKLSIIILTTFSAILISSTFLLNGFLKKQHFEEYAKIPSILNEYEIKYGSENITNACHINTLKYLDYYSNGKDYHFMTTFLSSNEDLLKLGRACDSTSDRYFCLVAFQPINPYAHQTIKARFPKLVDYQNFGDITKVYLFEKAKVEIPVSRANFQIVDTVFSTEYLTNFETEINLKPGEKFKFKALLNFGLDTTLTNLSLVVDFFDEQDKSVGWNGIPLRYFHSNDSINLLYEDEFKVPENSKKAIISLWNISKEKIEVKEFKLFI